MDRLSEALCYARPRVCFPMRSLNFFDLPDPSIRTMALGLTQSVTEMSTRNIPGE
jgi:hypothetical protein